MWAKQSHGIYMATDRDVPAGGSSSAPLAGFGHSHAISNIVRCALEKAGVKSACKGAHLLRHSLATDMLQKGASLDEIGEVLRHKSPDSTAIYAKVELEALRPLALHWPGGIK
jgi:integrase